MLGEILTAIVTPFKDDGSVDLDRFRALAAHLVENGSDGLVVTGTTGESPTLSDDERFQLYEAAVDEVGDRATVVAGTGTYSTAHSVHLTARAHELGVHGFLVVTPYYNKPPVRGIVEHFKAIAAVIGPPDRRVQHPEPRRPEPRDRRDRAARRDSDGDRGQAGEPGSRAGAPRSSSSASTCTRVTTTSSCRSSSSEARGGICVHTHVVGPQVKEMVTRYRAGDVDRSACARRGARGRPSTSCASRSTRSRSSARSTSSGTRSAASGSRSWRRRTTSARRFETASSASACSSRPPSSGKTFLARPVHSVAR